MYKIEKSTLAAALVGLRGSPEARGRGRVQSSEEESSERQI
jgi:hypothetical protein